MAQRGGSVLSTVRFGDKVWSPVSRHADVVVATELLEGRRALGMLAPRGTLVCAVTTRIAPGSVLRREDDYPDDLAAGAAARGVRLIARRRRGAGARGRHAARRQRRAARRRQRRAAVRRRSPGSGVSRRPCRPRSWRSTSGPSPSGATSVGEEDGAVKVTQLTVFLENRSGRLAEIADLLGKAGINIRGFSTTEAAEYGIVRLIVAEPERARAAAARRRLHDALLAGPLRQRAGRAGRPGRACSTQLADGRRLGRLPLQHLVQEHLLRGAATSIAPSSCSRTRSRCCPTRRCGRCEPASREEHLRDRTPPAGCTGSRRPRRMPTERAARDADGAPAGHAAPRLRQRPLLPQEARRGRHRARRRRAATATPPTCRSRPRSTCATTTRSACSRGRATRSCACTPRPARPATPPPSATRATTSTSGATSSRARSPPAASGPGDMLQNAYGYGLFTGGLGLHYGAERLGCTVLPISGGNTERQLKLMRDFGVTALACTPSYALYLADAARDRGLRPEDLPIRVGFHGAEPWTNEMRLADRGRPRHRRPRHLRALRDGRPGRRLRVPLQGRHARQRGPLPGRDRRPRDAAAAARGRGRRARLHDALAVRPSRSSATARATSAASLRARAPAAAPSRA